MRGLTPETRPDGTRIKQATTHGLITSVLEESTTGTVITGTTYTYDSLQRPLTVTDFRTGTTTYDLSNNTTGALTPDGEADVTESGKPLVVKTAASQTTRYTYDRLGRPLTVDAPDTLDATGATLTNITHTAYYPTGRVKATWGSQTYPTWHVYDEQGRQTQLHTWKTAPALDPASVPANPPSGSDLTTWIYSPTTGRLERKQYADGKGTDYLYTNAGRLEKRTWARAVTTTYRYTHGLLTSTDYSDTTPDVLITYDPLGRQKSISTAIAKSEFTHDPATFAVDHETISYNLDGAAGYEFTRVLDRKPTSLGRDTGFELKNGTNVENNATYGYSPTEGRLQTVVGASNGSFTYAYLPNSHLISTITGPVHTAAHSWSTNRDVLSGIKNKVGNTSKSQYLYTVNAIGQRTKIFDAIWPDGVTSAMLRQTNIGYDSLGQVISANKPGTAFDRAYQYDAIGNRLFAETSSPQISAPAGPNTTAYTPDALNQYSQITHNSLTNNPSHDDDGNLTSGPLPADPAANSTLVWDAENRLIETQVETSGPLVRHHYDAQSRKIATTANGTTTLYLYDGWNCIAEYLLHHSSFNLHTFRLWGMDLSGTLQGAGGVGGLLAENQNSDNFYPTYDGNGNVSEYLNAAGSVAAHYEYDPFGNTTVVTGPKAQDFAYRFSTKPLDANTGLYYYGYRYYDPVTGRWPSRDPIGERGGVSLYGFVGNNGINGLEHLGLFGYFGPGGNPAAGRPGFPFGDSGPGANDGIPGMDDHLRGSHEPYDNLGENDWWEKNQAELIAKHKQNAKNEISAQVDCDTKPTQVDGYNQSEYPTGQRLLFGTVGFVVDSKVTVSWDGCDWKWTATLNIEDKLGVDHTDSIPETILTVFGFPLIAPPTPVIRGSWEISDEGTCEE